MDPRLRADELDRGQRQLLALACGIAHRPRLLLADEPTSQLPAAGRDVVLAALHAVNQRWRTTIVLVTHDPAVVAGLPRTVTIRDGRIGAEGRRGEEFSVITADGITDAAAATCWPTIRPGPCCGSSDPVRGLSLEPIDPATTEDPR